MLENPNLKALTEVQTLAYILKFISDGKNEEQISEIFSGDKQLVKIWVETLIQIRFIAVNSCNELEVTSEGQYYLQKFNFHQ
jgi:hypothetical protein